MGPLAAVLLSTGLLTRLAGPDAGLAALLPFASAEGLERLARSPARADFPHLANEFESQENRAFCGVASSVIVLNALRGRNDRFPKPEDSRLAPPGFGGAAVAPSKPGAPPFDPLFHRFTQNDFFDAATDPVKRKDEILGAPRGPGAPHDGGLQLRQLAGLLRAHGLAVDLRVADDQLDLATIRHEWAENLARAGDYVLVNYARGGVGQEGGGHISPLGAYDPASDSVLVLDVNPNDHPWVWVPVPALVGAMRTKDRVENRGYVVVREGSAP